MTCVVCRIGQTRPGRTDRDPGACRHDPSLQGVPAEVCCNCGEAYVDQETTRSLLQDAEEAASSGVQVDIREFAGAAR